MELFANVPQCNAAGTSGTTSPASGTVETWTVTTSSGFPAAVTGGPSFHFSDPAMIGEVMQCTNVSGTTWTVVRGSEGTVPVAHGLGCALREVVSAGTFGSFIQIARIVAFGADPMNVNSCDTAILNAIAACSPGMAIYADPVPAGGGYKINVPVVLPPGVGCLGQVSTATVGQGSGSVFKPSSTFTAGSWPTAAAFLIVDQATGGYSSQSEEQHIDGIMIDGSGLAAGGNVIGVSITNAGGVNGQALRTSLRNILAYNMTGWGFSVPNIGLNVQAHNLHARGCGTATTGSGGYQVHASDSEWTHCSAYSCYGDSWNITDSWDSVFDQIHAEHSTGPTAAGIRYTADTNNSTVAVGGVVISNYSVDGGQWHGVYLTSNTVTSCPPITLANGFVRRPGEGGTFAAYCVNGYMGKVNLVAPQAYPGQPDGGGSNHAAYGLQMASNGASTNVSVTGGTLIGNTAAFNIDGTQGLLTVSPETTFGSGIGTGELIYTPGVTLQAASSSQLVPVDAVLAMSPAGTLATSHDRSQITTSFTPVSGTVYFRLVRLVAGVPVGFANQMVGGTAKAGGTHGWAGYTSVATGLVVAVSADNTDAATTWGTINAPQSTALASPAATYTPPVTGAYWEFFCIVATTMPAIDTSTGPDTNVVTQAPIMCGPGATAQTTPPAVGAALAPTSGVSTNNFWAWAK